MINLKELAQNREFLDAIRMLVRHEVDEQTHELHKDYQDRIDELNRKIQTLERIQAEFDGMGLLKKLDELVQKFKNL